MTVNAVETYSLLRIPSYCRATCAGCTIGVTPLVSFLTVVRVAFLAITLPGLILSFLTTLLVTRLLIVYLSLVVPVVTYGSPVWRPSLIRDIVSLEKLQRRATKYMLQDYQLDYKSRLCQLKLLPLMYRLEFIEVIFFITQLNCRSSSFDILNCFSFSSSTTRCGSHKKLIHSSKTSSAARNTFFHRFPRLWNSLPPINLSSSITSLKRFIKSVFIKKFNDVFNPYDSHTLHIVCPCSTCSCLSIPTSFLSL